MRLASLADMDPRQRVDCSVKRNTYVSTLPPRPTSEQVGAAVGDVHAQDDMVWHEGKFQKRIGDHLAVREVTNLLIAILHQLNNESN